MEQLKLSGVQGARQSQSARGSVGFPVQPAVDRSCGTGGFCVCASLSEVEGWL